MERNNSLNLRTIKRASLEVGASVSFFRQLLRQGKLRKYKVNSATYISLNEFEALAAKQMSEQNATY